MSKKLQKTLHGATVLNEKSLHTALKEWYAQPNDRFEVPVDGFVVDIVRGDLLVEIQTRNFSAIKRKLTKLTVRHPVRLVYPIAREKWIVKLTEGASSQFSRRKSPKRGSIEHVFEELVSFPGLLLNPNFSIELLFIQEEEVRQHDTTRRWRRKGWVTYQRRLLQVMEQRLSGYQWIWVPLFPIRWLSRLLRPILLLPSLNPADWHRRWSIVYA